MSSDQLKFGLTNVPFEIDGAKDRQVKLKGTSVDLILLMVEEDPDPELWFYASADIG